METLDLTKLYELQKQLDLTIAQNHNVTYSTTRTSRTLSLLVEMGEFCNETRCFKYWSNKGPSPKDVCLEEFADALHFFLSLGIDIGVGNKVFNIEKLDEKPNEIFLNCYKLIIDFVNNRDELHYREAFTLFLNLGLTLGFTSDDIKKAYLKKLDKNYVRQETNY